MSVSSDKAATGRRVPQQERAARRVDTLLAAAEAVIAERGFDAATMTAIAERADASIGAVYQYFPNKEALVTALRTRYSDEMDTSWSALTAASEGLAIPDLVDRLFDMMVAFTVTHPAYIPLLSVSPTFARDAVARKGLRERFADLFRQYSPALSGDDAYRVAEVTLQVVKSLNPLFAVAKPKERKLLVREYKAVVTAYLQARLG